MMVRKIAQKEFIEIWRDGRFRVAGLIVFALLSVSLGIGWKNSRTARADREAAQTSSYQQWLDQGERNAHSASHYGLHTFKPVSAMSLVDRGVDAYAGTTVFLESHKQNEFRLRPAKDEASVTRFGEVTAAVVMQLLIPLLIILLAFSVFAGERESGTLRQVLSLGVSRRSLGIGKALGIGGVLLCLLVPASVLGVAALSVSATENSLAQDLARGAWLILFYLVYFAVLLLVSLAVSARASSRVALVSLLGFWVFAALIVPRASADLAKRVHPTPSKIDFSDRIGKEILAGENERQARLELRVLAEHGVAKVEDLPFNFAGLDLQDSEDEGNKIIDRHYGALNETFASQNRVQEAAALLSPAQAVRLVSMGLAGTDIAQQRHFADASEAYRRLMVREMNAAVEQNVGTLDPNYRGTQSLSRKPGRETWERVPPFSYQMPNVAWVLNNTAGSVAALGSWLLVALFAAAWAVSGMRVD